MNEQPAGENSIELLDGQCKDLWRINGIGETWGDRLRDEFGIVTLQDLAEISEKQARRVAKAVKGISLDMVKCWRNAAIELLSTQRLTEQKNTNLKAEANSPGMQDGWESFARFSTVIQMRQTTEEAWERRIVVTHITGDKSRIWPDEGEEWPGIESEQFWEWMVDQLVELAERKPAVKQLLGETRPIESSPAAIEPAAIQFTELRIWQPAQSETPRGVAKAGEMFRGWIDGGEPSTIDACFDLAEATVPGVEQAQGPYQVEFSIRNRATGESKSLGETKPANLAENEPPYSAKLSGIRLPPGYYRLLVVVRFQGPPASESHLVVPLLQVV